MRHQKAGRALGVKPAHRRAMMRNLVTSLVEHERVTTTVSRAKEVRRPLAKMITLGKKGDLGARRQALAYVKSKEAMSKLFGDLAERYADRQGGYVRIVRTASRRGDGAEMALVLLVDGPHDPLAEEKKSRRKRGGRRKAAVEEVAEGVKESKPSRRKAESTKAEAAKAEPADEAPAAVDAEAPAEPEAEAPAEAPEAAEEEKKD